MVSASACGRLNVEQLVGFPFALLCSESDSQTLPEHKWEVGGSPCPEASTQGDWNQVGGPAVLGQRLEQLPPSTSGVHSLLRRGRQSGAEGVLSQTCSSGKPTSSLLIHPTNSNQVPSLQYSECRPHLPHVICVLGGRDPKGVPSPIRASSGTCDRKHQWALVSPTTSSIQVPGRARVRERSTQQSRHRAPSGKGPRAGWAHMAVPCPSSFLLCLPKPHSPAQLPS